MAYLIGTDEAGYGPNLGPLAIGISVWKVPATLLATDLYNSLPESITDKKSRSDDRLAITDSKKLYTSGGKKTNLELAFFAALQNLSSRSVDFDNWRNVLQQVGNANLDVLKTVPWYADFNCDLPLDAAVSSIEQKANAFAQEMQRQSISLIDLQCQLVFPQKFNLYLDTQGNKSELLSHTTLQLLQQSMAQLEPGCVSILCDKHGGRNRYAAMLQKYFPDQLIEVLEESRLSSRYRWGVQEKRVDIEFRAKGDNFLPAALASIAAKYLRELSMMAFNQFWCSHDSQLKPTAGYPQDARRFVEKVRPLLKKLDIPLNTFWRNK
ncbi:MAG: hypothetical protein ACKVH8_19160 [Pirellulales bacterium]|jgi:ribonuclease HII